MKSAFLLMIGLSMLVASQSVAQNNVRELGIGLTSLNNFSLQYRWGNGTKFYRITGSLGAAASNGDGISSTYFYQDPSNGSQTNLINTNSTPANVSFGGAFSILRLKSISEKFGFMYGSSYGLTISYLNTKSTSVGSMGNIDGTYSPINNTSNSTLKSARASVGVVLGAYYQINDSFLVYAEVVPNIYFERRMTDTNSNNSSYVTQNDNRQDTTDSYGLAGFSNSGALLTFAYRFTKLPK